MGNVKNKKHPISITFIVTKAVYIIGFGILALTVSCLIFLSVIARKELFTSSVFANIESAIVLGYFGTVIFLTILIPFLTSKKLKKDGQAILNITEKIKGQDLDFEISYGRIKEINEILDSMNDMRIALKESLEKQWRLEQNRKKQISALAHDFKTPMTVLKGNIDLLESSNMDDIHNEYIEDAKFSLDQMESYLSQFLEITSAERGYILNIEKLEFCETVNEIIYPLVRIAKEKEIIISIENEKRDILICADRLLLQRMINNIISNAIDFTNKKGNIRVKITATENNTILSITDSGPGFTLNALNHGTEQFYMNDDSRSRKNHYGLGLFISNCIIKQHNGTMQLTNDKDTGGAKIIISIPLIKE